MAAEDIARSIEALDATGYWWMVGKGKTKPSEPLFGCLIQEAKIDGETLAKAEGSTLMIRTYTDPGATVLDFCAGSGTVGRACEAEGREFIGIELSEPARVAV